MNDFHSCSEQPPRDLIFVALFSMSVTFFSGSSTVMVSVFQFRPRYWIFFTGSISDLSPLTLKPRQKNMMTAALVFRAHSSLSSSCCRKSSMYPTIRAFRAFLRNLTTGASTLVNNLALGPSPNMFVMYSYVRSLHTNRTNLYTVPCSGIEKYASDKSNDVM